MNLIDKMFVLMFHGRDVSIYTRCVIQCDVDARRLYENYHGGLCFLFFTFYCLGGFYDCVCVLKIARSVMVAQ